MRLPHLYPKGVLLAAASLASVLLFSTPAFADETDELINLAQSGVDEEVMITFIDQSPDVFDLSSDDIVTLKNLGVSSRVINGAMRHNRGGGSAEPSQSPPPSQVTAPPPGDLNVSYFYQALYPYGTWFNVDGMWCWRPGAIDGEPGWTPYCNRGHWVFTDWGWTWVSDYIWGWAPFHYGRWFRHPAHGWLWVPDNEWGPAWVTWRTSPEYFGWAPLPPRTRFVRNQGLYYGDRLVSAEFEFNLGPVDFCFIDNRHFRDADLRPHVVPPHVVQRIFGASAIIRSNYTTVENRIVDQGPAPSFVERVTQAPVRSITVVAADVRPGMPLPQGGITARGLILFKPPIAPGAPVSPLVIKERFEHAPRGGRMPPPPERVRDMEKRRADAMTTVVRKSRDEANSQDNRRRELEDRARMEHDPHKRESLMNEAAEAGRRAQEARQRAEKVEKWTPPPPRQDPRGHSGPPMGEEGRHDVDRHDDHGPGPGVAPQSDEEKRRHEEDMRHERERREQEKRDRDRREQESRR
jgi:hypothetical protein